MPVQAIFGQLFLGLINGSFYAMMSLGLAVIFGLLKIINFAHGVFFMLGAFVAWMLLQYFGLNYWWALVLAPLIVAAIGIVLERVVISRIYALDHIYGMLLTFGIALMLEGTFRNLFGSSGMAYSAPAELTGAWNLGFMVMPIYRVWVLISACVLCLGTWLAIEKTKLGSYLRAAAEKPETVQSFGINVPFLMTATFGFGVALASIAGVLAAPIYSVSPQMGSDLIITVFAVVVIGGMGSIGGAIIVGFALGIAESVVRLVYPQASATIVFVIMAIVLVSRPSGLFGKA